MHLLNLLYSKRKIETELDKGDKIIDDFSDRYEDLDLDIEELLFNPDNQKYFEPYPWK